MAKARAPKAKSTRKPAAKPKPAGRASGRASPKAGPAKARAAKRTGSKAKAKVTKTTPEVAKTKPEVAKTKPKVAKTKPKVAKTKAVVAKPEPVAKHNQSSSMISRPQPVANRKQSPAKPPSSPPAPKPRPKTAARPLAGTFPLEAARALWYTRQSLGPGPHEPLPKMIAKSGWLRTLGGADVYIAARAREPGMSRSDLDGAVATHALRVLPAVRSCIYLVPEEHASVARHFADGIWRKRTDREVVKAGTSWEEIRDVGDHVRAALERGPLSTHAIRKAFPPSAVRSLGPEGKKLGLSSPLPIALRDLELRGLIERTLEGGHLDTDQYLWREAQPTAPEAGHPTLTEQDLLDSIAKIFFSQMGPATVADFATWAGVSQSDAMAAIERIALLPVAIEGYTPVAYVDDTGFPALSQPAPLGDHVTFLSFEDNLIVPHGGPGLFCDPAYHAIDVSSWGLSRPTTLGLAKHLSTRTILVGDKIAGFWELDPDAQEIVTWMFDPNDRALTDHVESEATTLARFLFEEIGHARSFSLDTDDAVRERATSLRQRVRA
ncbi:MAG: hypothetical protein HOW73_20825 [Polyangiaceae bacterium]|nr:hypothetical protein [Polyangiaceae bacterium]